MDEIISSLRSSPLFYLFLSSRELFHTNFWFWLSTLNEFETLKLFGSDSNSNKALSFVREHKQSSRVDKKIKSEVDLLINCGNRPLIVVENKVKDFPTSAQLLRIRKSFDDQALSYVLTTLFSYPELVFEGWQMRTYGDISSDIVPENFTKNEYYRALIRDYKDFTKSLSDLASLLPITDMYDFAIPFMPQLFDTLNEIKLWEGYQKLRASHLLNRFKAHRADIETSYLLNNQKATLIFHCPIKDNYEVQVSLEGNQFRKVIGGRNINQMAVNLLSKQVLFTANFVQRDGSHFCRYDNKGDKQYRYQYESIAPISFHKLFEKICNEIMIIEKQKFIIESCIPD